MPELPNIHETNQPQAWFFSYSRKDEHFVELMHLLLKSTGVVVHRDTTELTLGDKWAETLNQFLAASDIVALFWSANSAKSKPVEREIDLALQLQKKIVPILMDRTQLPDHLRVYHGLDLSKHLKVRRLPPTYHSGLILGVGGGSLNARLRDFFSRSRERGLDIKRRQDDIVFEKVRGLVRSAKSLLTEGK